MTGRARHPRLGNAAARRPRRYDRAVPPTAFVYGPHLQAYNPSDDAERPLRRELGIELLRAYGLLDHPDVTVHDPRAGHRRRDHGRPLAAPTSTRSSATAPTPPLAAEPEGQVWGFHDGDTRARPGMHEAAAAACGSALIGALEIWEGRALQAFCPAPAGLHHAMANRASGMCIYNDAAVAIRALLERGAERVAYVDIDAHHGNGVQWIFYEDPRVLTVLGARERPLPLPRHRRPGRAGRRRRRGHLDQRAAPALLRRRPVPGARSRTWSRRPCAASAPTWWSR